MDTLVVLKDIGARSNGDVYLGVVGPVRVGKSTFIKRFMEVFVLPHITDENERKRALDELPQSGAGKTIMTMEPKFVPANAVNLPLEGGLSVKVRLIDCVGYIIEAAHGYLEDGRMRMVKTPWFSETIPFDDAAKIGTQKVIKEHSTIGIVVMCDGTIGDLKRSDYENAEDQVVEEMKVINRPFVIILNSTTPNSTQTKELAATLEKKHQVPVIPLNAEDMREEDAGEVMRKALYQFPVVSIDIALPKWVAVLDDEHYIKQSIKDTVAQAMNEATLVKDVDKINEILRTNEYLAEVNIAGVDTGTGIVTVQMEVHEGLYEKVLKELVGCEISDKSELMAVLTEFVRAKRDYDLIGTALKMAEETGYGFTGSGMNQLKIEKPTATKAGSRYGIKVKASMPTYHIIKVDVDTAFEPILGAKMQSDYFINYLSKAYDEDPQLVLECEMFGQKFKDIIVGGISSKLSALPDPVKVKLHQLIKTISNKGKTNLIAFVF